MNPEVSWLILSRLSNRLASLVYVKDFTSNISSYALKHEEESQEVGWGSKQKNAGPSETPIKGATTTGDRSLGASTAAARGQSAMVLGNNPGAWLDTQVNYPEWEHHIVTPQNVLHRSKITCALLKPMHKRCSMRAGDRILASLFGKTQWGQLASRFGLKLGFSPVLLGLKWMSFLKFVTKLLTEKLLFTNYSNFA